MHMALLQRSSAPTSTVMTGGGNTTSPMGTYIDGIAGGGRFATANGEHGGKCIAGVTGLSWRPCLNTSMEKGVAEDLIDGAGGRMAGNGDVSLMTPVLLPQIQEAQTSQVVTYVHVFQICSIQVELVRLWRCWCERILRS